MELSIVQRLQNSYEATGYVIWMLSLHDCMFAWSLCQLPFCFLYTLAIHVPVCVLGQNKNEMLDLPPSAKKYFQLTLFKWKVERIASPAGGRSSAACIL